MKVVVHQMESRMDTAESAYNAIARSKAVAESPLKFFGLVSILQQRSFFLSFPPLFWSALQSLSSVALVIPTFLSLSLSLSLSHLSLTSLSHISLSVSRCMFSNCFCLCSVDRVRIDKKCHIGKRSNFLTWIAFSLGSKI